MNQYKVLTAKKSFLYFTDYSKTKNAKKEDEVKEKKRDIAIKYINIH